MAAAVPNTDISTMLGSLLEIIQKYEDNDPENPPKEGDYLLAMNTLKALNDRKGQFGSGQNQMVVIMRERIRRIPNLLEITQRHAGWMMKKLMNYVECDVCGSQLRDEYALNRHKKRATCLTERARRFYFSEVFAVRRARWAARGWELDFPFVAAMMGIIDETRPVIVILPVPDRSREYQTPAHMCPRRLIPSMLWESIWSATAQSVNPKFAFRYEPNMFCGHIVRDGPTGFLRLFRGSIIPQGRKLHIRDAQEQFNCATSLIRSLRPDHTLRHYENWSVCMADRQPLIQLMIAPRQRPRFKCVPELINLVAGANPLTQFPGEPTNFSRVVPQAPASEPAVEPQPSDEEDNYNV